jgi:transposase
MGRKLTSLERAQLINHHRKEKNSKIRDRIKAVLAYDDGYSYSEIARILLLDDETIRRHIDDYFSKHKLSPESGGSTSHLNEIQTTELLKHLEEKTYLHVKDICAYVRNIFGMSYKVSGMTKWLRYHNFRYKKPHGVPSKANSEKQEAFMQAYAELKVTLPEQEIIYFGDSVHPSHQTRLSYGWIKKGVRKAEKMTACQKRVNLIGAINLKSQAVVIEPVEWVNVESLKQFAERLIQANPNAKKIHWILDNAGYNKSHEFTEWISQTNIQIHYLPPYSPNLNPIERLWKIMHENITYNRYYEKFAEFKKAIIDFFDRIKEYHLIIKSRVTDNFQKLVVAE